MTHHRAPLLSSSARTALGPVTWQKWQYRNDAWGHVAGCAHPCGKVKAGEGQGLFQGTKPRPDHCTFPMRLLERCVLKEQTGAQGRMERLEEFLNGSQ